MNMVKVNADQTYATAACRELLGAVPGEGAIDAPLSDNLIASIVLAAAHRVTAQDDENPRTVRRLCAALWGLNGDMHWNHYQYHRPINFLLRVMSLLDMGRASNGNSCAYHCRRYFQGHRITEAGLCHQHLSSVLDQSYWQRGTWYHLQFKELMRFAKAGLVRKIKLAEAEAVLETLVAHLHPKYSLDPKDGCLPLPTLHCNTSRGGTREVEYADCMAWAQLTTAVKMLPKYAHQLLKPTSIGMLRDVYAKLHAQRVRYATWAFAQPHSFQQCMDSWDAVVLNRSRQTGYSTYSITASPPWWTESLDAMTNCLKPFKQAVDFTSELPAITPLLRDGFELSTTMAKPTTRGRSHAYVVDVKPGRAVTAKVEKAPKRRRGYRQVSWTDDMIIAALQLRATGIKWRIIARRLKVKCTGTAISQACHKRMPEKTAKANEQAQAARAGA